MQQAEALPYTAATCQAILHESELHKSEYDHHAVSYLQHSRGTACLIANPLEGKQPKDSRCHASVLCLVMELT